MRCGTRRATADACARLRLRLRSYLGLEGAGPCESRSACLVDYFLANTLRFGISLGLVLFHPDGIWMPILGCNLCSIGCNNCIEGGHVYKAIAHGLCASCCVPALSDPAIIVTWTPAATVSGSSK